MATDNDPIFAEQVRWTGIFEYSVLVTMFAIERSTSFQNPLTLLSILDSSMIKSIRQRPLLTHGGSCCALVGPARTNWAVLGWKGHDRILSIDAQELNRVRWIYGVLLKVCLFLVTLGFIIAKTRATADCGTVPPNF